MAQADPHPAASHPTAAGGATWSAKGARLGLLVGVVLSAVTCLPLILTGFMRGRGAFDQLNFHERAIRTFADQWPSPDVGDYLSATTPGYHLVLALFANLGLDSLVVLRLIGWVFTAALCGLIGWWCGGRAGRRGAVLAAPMACSLYIVQSGAWLLPDNAGWLGVVIVLLLCVRQRVGWGTLAACGATLAVLIVFRQIHVWTAGAILAAAWLLPEDDDRAALPVSRLADRVGRVVIALLACAPGVVVLARFVRIWDGLTPPTFKAMYSGVSPAAPAFFLSIFGGVSVFFAPILWPGVAALWRSNRGVFAAAALLGLGLAVFPETTYQAPQRSSGLWNLARLAPSLGGTSVVIAILAPMGGVALAGWFRLVRPRIAWTLAGAIAAFVMAQAASPLLWQRYTEPFALIVAAMAASSAIAWSGASSRRTRDAMLGAAGLAVVLTGIAATEILGGRPATDRARPGTLTGDQGRP